MTKQCKNCIHSVSYTGQGGGKAYICHKRPSKSKIVGTPKYERVNPTSICEEYETRVK